MTIAIQKPSLLFPFFALAVGGCATNSGSTSSLSHDNLDAVSWIQQSTEYGAATRSIYAAATSVLRDLVEANSNKASRMAVVLDVDETVLDNSSYQAQLIIDDSTYESASWDQWIKLGEAPAVPGVVDFINEAQALGVHVAFVTNRACRTRAGATERCPQHQETLKNIDETGIDTATTALYLRGGLPSTACSELLTAAEKADGVWSSDKTSRRACVALDHEVVMLFGDQLGDFIEHEEGALGETGRNVAADFSSNWGKRWFMLPNPSYGDWRPASSTEKRRQLRSID